MENTENLSDKKRLRSNSKENDTRKVRKCQVTF